MLLNIISYVRICRMVVREEYLCGSRNSLHNCHISSHYYCYNRVREKWNYIDDCLSFFHLFGLAIRSDKIRLYLLHFTKLPDTKQSLILKFKRNTTLSSVFYWHSFVFLFLSEDIMQYRRYECYSMRILPEAKAGG